MLTKSSAIAKRCTSLGLKHPTEVTRTNRVWGGAKSKLRSQGFLPQLQGLSCKHIERHSCGKGAQ